jgi:hypothetical protein
MSVMHGCQCAPFDVMLPVIVIRGRLTGSDKGALQSNSHVEGDLTHKSLAIANPASLRPSRSLRP